MNYPGLDNHWLDDRKEVAMPNGKPGDHPYTDIVVHKRDVYSQRAADLVREIASLSDEKGRHQLADLLWRDYDEFGKPDVAKLERVLMEIRDDLKAQAKSRGFES
jgi:hypothetical protein